MAFPLYNGHNAPTQRPTYAHAGLWYQRFFDQFGYQWKVRDEKTDWLKNNFSRKTGDATQLANYALKQYQLSKSLKGDAHVFSTEWHFVTGMGNPHPVENGLSWHPTLGVPYLTGAAVKGIVRSWLEIWVKETGDTQQKLLDWFGSASKNPDDLSSQEAETFQTQAGSIIFFDAIPTKPVEMNVDIMTPHMGNWYQKGGKIKSISKDHDAIPADWHEPKPIPFLAVKKAHFLFSFALRPQSADQQPNIELKQIQEALENALDYMGAGAKTATGYGQMLANPRETQSLQDESKQQALTATMQTLSEEQQQLLELQQMLIKDEATGNCAPGNPTYQRMMGLIKQADNWQQDDRNTLAEHIETFFSLSSWGKGKKKRERKEMINKLREGE